MAAVGNNVQPASSARAVRACWCVKQVKPSAATLCAQAFLQTPTTAALAAQSVPQVSRVVAVSAELSATTEPTVEPAARSVVWGKPAAVERVRT